MYMYDVTYHRPATLKDAAELFAKVDEASFLSGGHTLLPAMKGRLAAPANLIDLRRIPELSGITAGAEKIVIGAATTHATVAASGEIAARIPALCGLAGSIGDVQVRHVGTMGGSVANNDPAADYPSAVLSLDATIHTNMRAIATDAYFTGLYSTALEDGEILTNIEFRVPQIAGYAKFRNPASRYSLAAAFVSKFNDGKVRVAITGAGDGGVFRWSEAEAALEGDFSVAALADVPVSANTMMGDIHASAKYRAHLVKVMTRRALENMGNAVVY